VARQSVMRRSIIRHFLCFLLIGFVLNWAVAVFLSVTVNYRTRPSRESTKWAFAIDRGAGEPAYLGGLSTRWNGAARYSTGARIIGDSSAYEPLTDIRRVPIERWALPHAAPWLVECRWPARLETRVVEARGWPMLSTFWWYNTWGTDWMNKRPAIAGGLRISDEWTPKVIPYAPLWPGMIANSAVYGTSSCLVVALARILIFRRRGRCRNCGYPREGLPASSVCPECGSMPSRTA
jgi:hypothetical protein